MAVKGFGCRARSPSAPGSKATRPGRGTLVEGLPAKVVMADTAYDADPFRQAIAEKGARAVIPNYLCRAEKHPLDKHLYAQRHLVATRFEKTARNYRAVVILAAIVLWLRKLSTPPRARHQQLSVLERYWPVRFSLGRLPFRLGGLRGSQCDF
jgi:transposase